MPNPDTALRDAESPPVQPSADDLRMHSTMTNQTSGRQTFARTTIPAVWREIRKRALSLWNRLREDNSNLDLRSLRPKYAAVSHGEYVEVLIRELKRKDPARNIAVSGPYGSGKSSVLLELRRRRFRHGAVEVALATLEEPDKPGPDQGNPDRRSVSVVTETLQKEIVKRLLYAAKAAKLPRSQLNRIRGVDWRRAIVLAVLSGLVLGGLAWIYNVQAPFHHLSVDLKPVLEKLPVDLNSNREWIARVLDGLLAASAVLLLQWLLSFVRLREVAVGEFKLSREDPNQNYFDQYLDEIIYFFSRTGTRLVIFEDLDRFGDRGIFVALRELNVLLNNTDAIKRPVTFVYAIRDSVFTPLARAKGAEGVAAAATDRSKFFDLILPVVPFVTTEVSGGLLMAELQLMPESERPDANLVGLAGRYFPDIRVLRTIANEYQIYFDRLIRHGEVELDQNHLFAILLYKQGFPEDYERIQFRASKFDLLFEEIDKDVALRLTGIDHETALAQNELSAGSAMDERASQAGERLLSIMALFGSGGRRSTVTQIVLDGPPLTADDARTIKFWRDLDREPTRDVSFTLASGASPVLNRANLNVALPEDLPAEQWIKSVNKSGAEALERLRSIRRDLQHGNLHERIGDSRFRGAGRDGEGNALPIDFLATARKHLGTELALELAQLGFIDRDFHLYTSLYQGSLVSAAAQSYRVQQINQRLSAPLALLTAEDISEIRAKIGDSFLEEPSVLNVSIFDHLMDGSVLDEAFSLIAREVLDGSKKFAATYLASGAKPEAFVQRLAKLAPWSLTLIANESELSEELKKRYFAQALVAVRADLDYELTAEAQAIVVSIAQDSFGGIGQRLRRGAAQVVGRLVATSGARVPDLSKLSHDGRQAIGDQGAYVMNRPNLSALAGAKGKAGLDSIAKGSPTALRRVLERLPEYLDAIDLAHLSSIDEVEDLLELITVVAEYGPAAVEGVWRRAPTEALIDEIPGDPDTVSPELVASYPVLAQELAFSPTARNTLSYLDVVGGVDRSLVAFLTANPVLTAAENLAEAERSRLLKMLVESDSLAVAVILSLVRSVSSTGQLDVRSVVVARPEVVEGLMSDGIVLSDLETHTAILQWPWGAREAALAQSNVVAEFVSQLALTPDDVARILASRKVGKALKHAVLADPAFVTLIQTRPVANEALELAADDNLPLTAAQLVALKAVGGSDANVVQYLGRAGQNLRDQEITAVIASLGGDWPILSAPGNSWRLFPASRALEALLERLKRMGLVSKVTPALGGRLRVTMRPH